MCTRAHARAYISTHVTDLESTTEDSFCTVFEQKCILAHWKHGGLVLLSCLTRSSITDHCFSILSHLK